MDASSMIAAVCSDLTGINLTLDNFTEMDPDYLDYLPKSLGGSFSFNSQTSETDAMSQMIACCCN